jgi:hypothetical protein
MAITELLPISVVSDPFGFGTGTWQYVDEPYASPTDADYLSMGVPNSGATVHQVLGYDASAIPIGATINSVTVKVRGKSTLTELGGTGLGSIWGALAVGGNWYATPEYHDGTLTSHSVTWTTNPDTGQAWDRYDLGAGGSHLLYGLGIQGVPWASEQGETWHPWEGGK